MGADAKNRLNGKGFKDYQSKLIQITCCLTNIPCYFIYSYVFADHVLHHHVAYKYDKLLILKKMWNRRFVSIVNMKYSILNGLY